EGKEHEDVLMLDPGVINKTIPLILCTEEDVFGSHGATIGRLDEELMFYLKSRGLSEENVFEMVSRARLLAVINEVPDENIKSEIYGFLGIENDED
ncbi:MAG: SufD family Fe-S cluster assembly protein, partial [Lachnospiraceae bacterium]|nr:SufD family Fe-S cluster assembly protein [Lachnospiraceae bacterium]